MVTLSRGMCTHCRRPRVTRILLELLHCTLQCTGNMAIGGLPSLQAATTGYSFILVLALLSCCQTCNAGSAAATATAASCQRGGPPRRQSGGDSSSITGIRCNRLGLARSLPGLRGGGGVGSPTGASSSDALRGKTPLALLDGY